MEDNPRKHKTTFGNDLSDEQDKPVKPVAPVQMGSMSNVPIKPTKHFHMPPKTGAHSAQSLHSQNTHADVTPGRWDQYFEEMYYLDDGTSVFKSGNKGAVFLCIHGAGQSAMSFAALAREVRKFGIAVAFDLKGHGHSKNDKKLDEMSIEALLEETQGITHALLDRYQENNFILVGHSLGGSIATRLADRASKGTWGKRIHGLIVIDVVQGTAIEALPFMMNILENRPKIFKSIESAIHWSVQSNTLRNLESARVSIPSQLRETIINGDERKYEWKVDLAKTNKFWQDWFIGLSSMFLGVQMPKILLTAEKERLDKELTIAQMQGRFRCTVVNNVGHSVQEDDFRTTAKHLHDFLFMFRIPQTLEQEQYMKQIGIANFHPNLNKYG